MYRYKAKLASTNEVITQSNTIEDLEHNIVTFRRLQKYAVHTRANDKIQIYHIEQNHKIGKRASKEVLIKVV